MATSSLELLAPAKLNLHLGIYPGRDERGYHRADSVMIGIALADRVHIAPADNLVVTTSIDCGVPQQRNTAFRAARELCRTFGKDEGYAIHIDKRVPSQAGMGGASSDAASVLLGLCKLWDVDPLDERVVTVARSIGADVPFFLTLNPALLTGAGDVLEQTFPLLEDVPIVLVRPDVGVSTVEAYRAFDADPIEPPSPQAMCAALAKGDARAVAEALYNNLEPAANRLAPVTAEVREWLRQQDWVVAAQLTGSGSCVFGLCESHEAARRIAQDAQETRNWWSCATTTVGAGAQFC